MLIEPVDATTHETRNCTAWLGALAASADVTRISARCASRSA